MSAEGTYEPVSISHDAIRYVLRRIAREEELAWRFIGTEAYAKLIAAEAALTCTPESEVKALYRPIGSYCCRACERREEESRAGRAA